MGESTESSPVPSIQDHINAECCLLHVALEANDHLVKQEKIMFTNPITVNHGDKDESCAVEGFWVFHEEGEIFGISVRMNFPSSLPAGYHFTAGTRGVETTGFLAPHTQLALLRQIVERVEEVGGNRVITGELTDDEVGGMVISRNGGLVLEVEP